MTSRIEELLAELIRVADQKPVSFEQAQAARAAMVEGRAAQPNESIEIRIPNIWRAGKDGPYVSVYCTAEVSRGYKVDGNKADHYGNVVNFRNVRWHDGDDAEYSQMSDSKGRPIMSRSFSARHVCDGNLSDISWPVDVDPATRAHFHREHFVAAIMNLVNKPFNDAYRVSVPLPPEVPAAHEPGKHSKK